MMRFIMPIILISLSITVFFMFAKPFYDSTDPLSPGVLTLNKQLVSYNEALDNHIAYENAIDSLTKKDNDINPDDKAKLQKLLPDNIDNIRLILEIEQIASPYGMVLKDVRYSSTDKTKSATPTGAGVPQGNATAKTTNKDYGVWDLEFSTTGTYNNFLSFMKDMESNLRIVDISSIQFSSATTSGSGSSLSSPANESYKYDFKIKTYWLKN